MWREASVRQLRAASFIADATELRSPQNCGSRVFTVLRASCSEATGNVLQVPETKGILLVSGKVGFGEPSEVGPQFVLLSADVMSAFLQLS